MDKYPIGCNTDEYISYFKLYGELIFCVPHYYKSYKKTPDGGEEAVFPSGTSIKIFPPTKEFRSN